MCLGFIVNLSANIERGWVGGGGGRGEDGRLMLYWAVDSYSIYARAVHNNFCQDYLNTIFDTPIFEFPTFII